VQGNYAGFSGGGIFNSGSLTMRSCTVADNGAEVQNSADGGGIFSQGALALIGCTFLSNHANEGGAVRSVSSLLTVTNCTFATNTAELGGACSVADGGAAAAFVHVTITANTALDNFFDGGGGLFLYNKAVTLANSVIAGSNCASAPDFRPADSSPVTLRGVNLVGDLTGSTSNRSVGQLRRAYANHAACKPRTIRAASIAS
jgi:hypothetical protein